MERISFGIVSTVMLIAVFVAKSLQVIAACRRPMKV